MDKDSTKTGDDRRIALCPRAIGVLNRQLALRAKLIREGRIEHNYLFFKENGKPLRNLLYPGHRWRRTLRRLTGIRYRRPYIARHTSVSWDLMIGRSALWVARQHDHSISTMNSELPPRQTQKPPRQQRGKFAGERDSHRLPMALFSEESSKLP